MCLWCANTDTNAETNTSTDAITKPYKETKTDTDTDVTTDTNAKNDKNAYTNMNTLTILIQMHTPMRVRKIIHASNGIFICVCLLQFLICAGAKLRRRRHGVAVEDRILDQNQNSP